MHRAGYKNWRFKAHETFHEGRKSTWDESNLDVTRDLASGPGSAKKTPASDIPFKNLAMDVRREPQATPSMCETVAPKTQQESKKTKGRLKRTVRIEEEQEFARIAREDENVMIQASQYLLATAYVAPPGNAIMLWEVATESGDEAVDLAFARGGQVGESGPHSAYAFGGPRRSPPYQQLYRIDLPDPADVSSWAENLRWAFAQNTLFRYPCRPDAWNESPEHMECIVQIRGDRGWKSDEFLAKEEK
ncbi:unnamed protein product [Alternaria alternata]